MAALSPHTLSFEATFDPPHVRSGCDTHSAPRIRLRRVPRVPVLHLGLLTFSQRAATRYAVFNFAPFQWPRIPHFSTDRSQTGKTYTLRFCTYVLLFSILFSSPSLSSPLPSPLPPRVHNRLQLRDLFPVVPAHSNSFVVCSLRTLLHFFAGTQNSTLFFSSHCALFAKNMGGGGLNGQSSRLHFALPLRIPAQLGILVILKGQFR